MSQPNPKKPVDEPTTLYRLYDQTEELVYVGIASNPGRRFEQHKADKTWWGEVSRIELVHFASRGEAAHAEREAIKTENPRFNIVHTRDLRRFAQKIQVWCESCNQAVEGDSGYLTVNMADVQKCEDAQHALDATQKDKPFPCYTTSQIMALPAEAKWRGLHHGCDPRPQSVDYWMKSDDFHTWHDVLETTAHLMEKNWLRHTNWEDVLRGVVSGHGPLRSAQ